MERKILTVVTNSPINALGNVLKMELSGCDCQQRPGQFVDIELDGLFLRRPISVCDWRDGVLTLLYKVVGKGTALMAGMKPGQSLDVLCSLGNGFETDLPDVSRPLLVGGGIGTAPLYLLARRLVERGVQSTVILGFNTAAEIIMEEEFKSLGAKTIVATADGSYGVRGFVTDALPLLAASGATEYTSEDAREGTPENASENTPEDAGYDYCYACGPMPMMRALAPKLQSPAQFSLEERMGCGTGICMGCTCPQLTGSKRICKDGPVFNLDEINL